MSVETITVIVSAIGVVVTLGLAMFAGFGWCVRRIDAVDSRLGDRIDAVDSRLGDRIDAVDLKLSNRIDALAKDLTDVKISVARLEGVRPHLIVPER